MARARLLKPGFFSNEDLAEIGPLGQLLFAGLWTVADKAGRLDDRPKRIKAAVFPYYDADVASLLDGLDEKGFIHRYQIEDAHFIQIVKWDHQHPHRNEPDSIIPPPSAYMPLVADETTIGGTTPAIVRSEPANVRRRPAEAKAKAESEAKAEEGDAPSGADPLPFEPKREKRERKRVLNEEDIAVVVDEHPTLNVPREAQKFRDYVLAKRPKYVDEVAAFRNWLRRAEDDKRVQSNGRSAAVVGYDYEGSGSRIAARLRNG
jgi:hypothetical protein